MADLKPGVAVTAKAVATVLLAAVTLVGITTFRNFIGAGTSSYVDPLTTNGDTVVRAAGVTTRLGTAGAADGGVLTVANGAPFWGAAPSYYVDPLTTNGDMLVRAGGVTTRLGTAGAADGGVLTVTNGAPGWASVASSGSSVTTLYASDGVAVAGSESASISGTGSASTVTITASSTARTFGTAGQTAAGWRLDLPTTSLTVSVEVQFTAASGFATGGYRYIGLAISNTSNVTATLFGASFADNGSMYAGNMLTGANGGTQGPYTYTPTLTAADRWVRARWDLDGGPRIQTATGSGSSGARPGTWVPPASVISPFASAAAPTIVDSSVARLWLYLQGFGTGGATSITASITVRVTR